MPCHVSYQTVLHSIVFSLKPFLLFYSLHINVMQNDAKCVDDGLNTIITLHDYQFSVL